jgi:hypothetical protein
VRKFLKVVSKNNTNENDKKIIRPLIFGTLLLNRIMDKPWKIAIITK